MRVAIYCRVSTSDKGQDTDNQLEPLRQFVTTQSGWNIVREYIEHESASGRAHRGQFQNMMQDAEEKKFDLLLFWALDRFSREGASVTLNHLTRLTKAGVKWKSLQEPYLDTTSLGPFAEGVIAIIASIAKMESQRRSDRVKAGLQRRKAAGKSLGAKRIDLPGDQIKKLWEEGYSIRAIAKHFNVSRGTLNSRLIELGMKTGTKTKTKSKKQLSKLEKETEKDEITTTS